ncbi:MAG: molybdenum cofactor biosynthesis protein MoaE [Planctomycetota bacterium]
MSDAVRVELVEGPLGQAGSPPPPGAGAWVTFEGIVRPLEDDRQLVALDYEAYEPMTKRELQRLAAKVVEEHGLLAIVVEHSVGRVTVGETSFRLSVGSAHRAEAIAATDAFIERMKRDVPLWKTAVYA